MKLKLLDWIDQNRGLYILVFNLFPSIFLHSLVHLKTSNFLSSLVIGDIIEAKFLVKHLLNYAIPLKTSISWEAVGTSMFTKASTFLGSITFPSLDTMKHRKVFENTINMHFSGFKLIPNFLHLRKNFLNFTRF